MPINFNFGTISFDIVRKYLFEIKPFDTGADKMILKMLLFCVDRIVHFSTNIVNSSCIIENRFPDVLIISKINPHLKIDINEFNDLKNLLIRAKQLDFYLLSIERHDRIKHPFHSILSYISFDSDAIDFIREYLIYRKQKIR